MNKIRILGLIAASVAYTASPVAGMAQEVSDGAVDEVTVDDGSAELADDSGITDGEEVAIDEEVIDPSPLEDGIDNPEIMYMAGGANFRGDDEADMIADRTAERVLDRVEMTSSTN